jgi:hypothetical protein
LLLLLLIGVVVVAPTISGAARLVDERDEE